MNNLKILSTCSACILVLLLEGKMGKNWPDAPDISMHAKVNICNSAFESFLLFLCLQKSSGPKFWLLFDVDVYDNFEKPAAMKHSSKEPTYFQPGKKICATLGSNPASPGQLGTMNCHYNF